MQVGILRCDENKTNKRPNRLLLNQLPRRVEVEHHNRRPRQNAIVANGAIRASDDNVCSTLKAGGDRKHAVCNRDEHLGQAREKRGIRPCVSRRIGVIDLHDCACLQRVSVQSESGKCLDWKSGVG